MKMKPKYLHALLLATLIYSCDDSTTGIGDSTIAAGDSIPAGVAMKPHHAPFLPILSMQEQAQLILVNIQTHNSENSLPTSSRNSIVQTTLNIRKLSRK